MSEQSVSERSGKKEIMKKLRPVLFGGAALFFVAFTVLAGMSESFAQGSQAASSAAAMQMAATGVNVAAGAAFSEQCSTNEMACVMAAMSIAQAMQTMSASQGSTASSDGMSTYDSGGYGASGVAANQGINEFGLKGAGTGPGVGGTDRKTMAQLGGEMRKLQEDLAKKGVTLGKDGQSVQLADGRSIPTSAMGSDAGMKGAGFSEAEIGQAKALMASVNAKLADKYKAVQMAAESGGGGGGSRKPAAGDDANGPGGFRMKFPWDKDPSKANKKASVSGMSKKLGTDNIGVSGDNIFDMVSRRYKLCDAKNDFFKN